MTYFSYNNRRWILRNFLAKGALTVFVVFISVSCSSSAGAGTQSVDSETVSSETVSSESQGAKVVAIASKESSDLKDTRKNVGKPMPSEDSTKALPESSVDSPEERNARREWMADRTDDGTPRSLSVTTKDIKAGSPYSDARTAFTNRGWIAHTQATTGPEYDWNNATLEEMRSLGYPEFYDCVGNICSAQFVYQDRTLENGPILTVSADISGDTAPTITDWAIKDTADATYVQRTFDAALFEQIQTEQSFCVSVGRCNFDRYILADALLLSGTYGFGSTKVSLIPRVPVSTATAIAYAKALDTERVIDFDASRFSPEKNAEIYSEAGLPSQNIAATSASLTQVSLVQTPEGKVSEISFELIVL